MLLGVLVMNLSQTQIDLEILDVISIPYMQFPNPLLSTPFAICVAASV